MGLNGEQSHSQAFGYARTLEKKFKHIYQPMSAEDVIKAHQFPESTNESIRYARKLMTSRGDPSHGPDHIGRMQRMYHQAKEERKLDELTPAEEERLCLSIELHDVFKSIVTKENESLPVSLWNNFREGLMAPAHARKIMEHNKVPKGLINEVAEDVAFHADFPLTFINPNTKSFSKPSKTGLLLLDLDWADMFSFQRGLEALERFEKQLKLSFVGTRVGIGRYILARYINAALFNFKHFENVTMANMLTFHDEFKNLAASVYGDSLFQSTPDQWRHILSAQVLRNGILNDPKYPIVERLIGCCTSEPHSITDFEPFFPEAKIFRLGSIGSEMHESHGKRTYRYYYVPHEKSTVNVVGKKYGAAQVKHVEITFDIASNKAERARFIEGITTQGETVLRTLLASFDSEGHFEALSDERQIITPENLQNTRFVYTSDDPFANLVGGTPSFFPDDYAKLFI